LNITCNFLYCNHQVHTASSITLLCCFYIPSVFKKNHISTDRYLLLIGTDRSIRTNLLESTIAYIRAWALADCDLIDITGLLVPQFLLKASECFVERTLTYDSCVFYTLRRVRKITDLKILKSTFRTVTSTPSPLPKSPTILCGVC
jgi:hypothetical protein